MVKVAIVGGGPGGLMAAYLLWNKCDAPLDITVFEASERVGGKILTRKFEKAPVIYEAGVAEFYGYSMTGPDPLREMIIETLGLEIVPMDGMTVTLGDKILRNAREISQKCGAKTWEAIREFRKICKEKLSPEGYYEGHWQDDNDHEWADLTTQEVLEKYVSDPIARKYLKVAAHSDIATEMHLTNGLNGLKNFLMDVGGYIYLYSIKGGNELLVQRLREEIEQKPECHIELNSPVTRIEKSPENKYRVTVRRNRQDETREFDFVAVALPNNWLMTIDYAGENLTKALQKHHAYYDTPAHYLRVTVLFKERFWKDIITDSWFMSDAFGGCCVYDETARHEGHGYGVLGWLIAGTDALTLANFTEAELIQKALDSLPEELQFGRDLFMEGKVQRWLYSVSGQPGGLPVRDPKSRHIPDPKEHPGFYLVGDYLMDSTLNGVLDSADFVTDMMLDQIMRQWYQETVVAASNGHLPESAALITRHTDRQFFENYRGQGHYSDTYQRFFNARFIKEAIQTAWKIKPPFSLLTIGSGNGLPLESLDKVGVNAWGIESNKYIHTLTEKKWARRNYFGKATNLPFKDEQFEFIYDTTLCYFAEREAIKAIREMHRVVKNGVIFGAVSTDVKPQAIQKFRLYDGVKTLLTLWEWAELFMAHGFELQVINDQTLKKLWRLESETRGNEGSWYNDIESVRYCYFKKVELDDEDED